MIGNMPAAAITVMQTQFNAQCIHSVTVAPFTGRDQFTDESWGTPVAHAAFVVFKQRQIVNRDGEQIAASGSAMLAFNNDGTAPIVGDDDKLTLPDATTARILAVERDPGNPAISPTVIFF